MHLAKATVFLGVLTIALAAICPRDWKRFGESCYYFITDKTLTWHEAKRMCFEKGASMVVPNSPEEQTFIWQMYKLFFDNPTKGLWIGCDDTNEEGKWNCPLRGDGKEYENWKDNQPDNKPSPANCAFMHYGDGRWGDWCCGESKYATCERAVNNATNPETYCNKMGSDGRVASRCPVSGHVIKELPGTGVLSCGKACRSEPQCQSFNLLKQNGGTTVCQLTNSTANDIDTENSGVNHNCVFFEL